jgi:signal transduction histidine kinase
MDSYLADILINNLISNAIKHGEKREEEILIYTTKSTLTISNFGDTALANPESLFLRFYRESKGAQSTGLGLAIVKKICDFYVFSLSYHHKEQKHIFSIQFK